MPDIFEVFSDHATTYLDFNNTRFKLEYRPSIITPKLFAQLTKEATQDEEDEGDTVTGDDGKEYSVFTPNTDSDDKRDNNDGLTVLPRTLAKVLIDWDVQINGETVPIEVEALMGIPTVFLNAVWQAIANDQSQGNRKSRRAAEAKGRANSFQ